MEPLVETLIEDSRWSAFGLEPLAESAVRAVLADRCLAAEGFAVSLLGCDDRRIAALNADFRGKPQPTNVLSWPSVERGAAEDGGQPDTPRPGVAGMPAELGDLAIAWETCAREAEDQGKSLQAHVTHLIVHASLHLLGYDHVRAGDAMLMEETEIRILAGLGLANPYE